MNEYVIVISSFFTAAYARDKLLRRNPYHTDEDPCPAFRKLGHGITLVTNEDGIENIKEVLRQNQIGWRAIFRLEKERGILRYKAI